MSRDFDDDVDHRSAPNRWGFLFSWTGFFLVGWVIYELTTEAALGVTVLCCKFGWTDVRTALWLRKRDPDHIRGKMSFWIFTAEGFLKAAFPAFLLMIVFIFVFAGVRNPGPPAFAPLEALLITTVGFFASSLATLRAVWLAQRHQKKIWLSPSIHEAARNDIWPPSAHGPNLAKNVTVCATATIVIFSLIGYAIAVATLPMPGWLAVTIFFVGIVLLYWASVWQRNVLEPRLLAARSSECWGTER